MQQFVDEEGEAYEHIANTMTNYTLNQVGSYGFTMGKATVQHLILKPLSLYGDFDFDEAYRKMMEDLPL